MPRAPATPNRTWTAVLRQIWWASIPIWSVGFLAFLPFLRIALGRRRKKDWAVFAAYAAAVAALGAVVSVRTTGAATVAGGAFVLALIITSAVHTAAEFRPARRDAAWSPQARQPDNRDAVATARNRIRRRNKAVKLIRADPALARDLRIGRPDLPQEYDDGGLVDVNRVPAHVLASHLGLRPDEVTSLVAARDKLGAFSSADELAAYAALSPGRIDELRDLMIFG